MTRELDAEVAEKVMGLKSRYDKVGDYAFIQVDGWHERSAQNYSTDISAAFQVVEKMRERGYEFSLDSNAFGSRHGEPEWIAAFGASSIMGETPPEAICRAALSALASRKESEDENAR